MLDLHEGREVGAGVDDVLAGDDEGVPATPVLTQLSWRFSSLQRREELERSAEQVLLDLPLAEDPHDGRSPSETRTKSVLVVDR